MTIKLTEHEFNEQFEETDEEHLQWDTSDKLDITYKFDARFSQGWRREIDLREGLWLRIDRHQLCDHFVINSCTEECESICIWFTLSGQGEAIYTSKPNDFLEPIIAGKYCLRSNGLDPLSVANYSDTHPYALIGLYIHPSILYSFVPSAEEMLPKNLQHLIKLQSQQTYLRSGDIQPMMATVLQQILHCPYQGMIKRAYLESKAIELTALVLDHEVAIQQGEIKKISLKPEQLERVHYAKEILLRDLSNPPSLETLARQAGLNDLLLRQGFRQVFGTTVFEILRSHRFELAKQLLAEQDLSVGEVAYRVGYTSVSHFSKAFEHRFGIRPKAYQKQCR